MSPPGGIAVDLRTLDTPPRLANPAEAAAAAAAGYARRGSPEAGEETVLLWLRVEPDGGVSDYRVLTGPSALASSVALNALRYMRYIPGTKAGVPLPVWVVQPIVFVP